MSDEDYRRGVRDGRVFERELIRLAGSLEAWEAELRRKAELAAQGATTIREGGRLRLVEPLEQEDTAC